jgi:taurine dioxygenase
MGGKPEIYIVSNVIENGIPIGSLGADELVWHTDMSYLEVRTNYYRTTP